MPSPEDKARENIDGLLTQAGWAVRDQSDANILAYRGVAIRNFSLKPGHGLADYLQPYAALTMQVHPAKQFK
jgi:type I restriction enzyme, R subunit